MLALFVLSGYIAMVITVGGLIGLGLVAGLSGHEDEKRFYSRVCSCAITYAVIAIVIAYSLI